MKTLKLKQLLKVLNPHIIVDLLDGDTEKLICCATVGELLHTKAKKYKKYLGMEVLEIKYIGMEELEIIPTVVYTNTYVTITIIPKEKVK
jgi:hypothetical protein